MKKNALSILFMFCTTLFAADLPIKDGDKVAFLGDSITAGGARGPSGYCYRVVKGLEVIGVKVTPVYAGKGGHKSNQMLSRLEKDVLSTKPQWMTLSCGVNDVWHGEKGVNLEDYKKNITQIVERCEAAGVKVMLLTSTMIGEDGENENNKKLEGYNAFLRELAKERTLPIADLYADMEAGLVEGVSGNQLTRDGVHMNASGDLMMATGVVKAFGVSGADLAKVRDSWLDVPNACDVRGTLKVSQRELLALQAMAHAKGTSLDKWMSEQVKDLIAEALSK